MSACLLVQGAAVPEFLGAVVLNNFLGEGAASPVLLDAVCPLLCVEHNLTSDLPAGVTGLGFRDTSFGLM